jgi:hypothetical protein
MVPALARKAAKVTMLQRSPGYLFSMPRVNPIYAALRTVLPKQASYTIIRSAALVFEKVLWVIARRFPNAVRAFVRRQNVSLLPQGYPVDVDFRPNYNPWDERMCLVADGDVFEEISKGRLEVVTDHIDHFDADGIMCTSGKHLDADIVVTATGLQMVTLGEVQFSVDGAAVDFADTWTYKGFAYSDVPNLASSFGYINASWTLRADLTCEYVCRLLNHLRATGTQQCTPRLRPGDRSMPARPWIGDFSAGYMQREMHRFPKQGDREPWINPQDYGRDKVMFRKSPLDDGVMQFTRAGQREARTDAQPAMRG